MSNTAQERMEEGGGIGGISSKGLSRTKLHKEGSMESQMNEGERIIYDTIQIQKIIPHRYPFLMVDRVIEFVDNQRIVALKNVSINEPFFQGHFPGRPVMPGVMILEAMAQTAAILAHASDAGVGPGKTVFLIGATDFKWKKQVVPGDTLRIVMESVKKRRPIWIMKGEAWVADKIVASGSVSAAEAE